MTRAELIEAMARASAEAVLKNEGWTYGEADYSPGSVHFRLAKLGIEAALSAIEQAGWGPADKVAELTAQLARKQDLLETIVSFVHRWTWGKEGTRATDAERLDVLKHYPPVAMIEAGRLK